MLRSSFVVTLLLGLAATAGAQLTPGSARERQIYGQIRIDGRAAPQGVLVLLDRARGRDATYSNGTGELGTAMTDSRGKFFFDHVDQGQEFTDGARYVVTVRYPGYRVATQVLDLTATRTGYANLDLLRDTSKDAPNVPPGGPGATISAKQPATPKAQEEWAKGQELLNKHDPRASIKNFKKVVELEPQYEMGYLLLGTAYLQTQEFGQAQSAFEKAAKINPRDPTAFLGLGNAMNQQHDFSGAVKPLQHSLELANSAEAHYELGRSLWGLGKWQDAEPHAQKALEISKDFAPAHVLMGNILLRHRDAKAALAEFQEYLRLEPQGQFAAPVKEIVAKIEKGLAQR
ncbi:MAG: tetratricopeptide repeat protein [Acidobacteriia bacterium]|nr:tetratricopeptide repeat protein [Terriglobia bacterium]